MNEPKKIRVLVADDEESFLKVLTTVLESANRYSVHTCEAGDEVVEALKKSQFDLVILDYKMPGMTGLNVLQWMHEQKSTIPVIMLTGAGSENIAVEAMKFGAYDYLRKDQFDKYHFPIVVNGVYERFLFKQEKELQEIKAREHEEYLASFELLRDSVASFAKIVNTTLVTIALLTDESEHLLHPLVLPEGRELFRRYFKKVREEYETLATVTKSIVNLSKVMYDNYEGMHAAQENLRETITNGKAGPQKVMRNY